MWHSRDTRYVIECLNGATRQSWNRPTDRPTDRPTQGQAVASNFRWWYPRVHTGTSYVRRRKRGHPFSRRAAYSFPLRPSSLLLSFSPTTSLSLSLSLSLSSTKTNTRRKRRHTTKPTIALTIGTYVDSREMTENCVWHREVPTGGKAL